MIGYYFDLALRSLKRSPGLTALMVLSIGVGVALAMSTWTLEHLMSGDPFPQKSAEIYFPTIDMWGPAAHAKASNSNDPPDLLDYGTAEALLRDHRATYQAAVYAVIPTLVPASSDVHPFREFGFAVSGEFFPMLDVPFRYGAGWSTAADAARAQVVVISGELNDKLFGGADSVGKVLRIDGREYQVVGVLGDWQPHPAFYAIPSVGALLQNSPGLFVPFDTAIAAQMPDDGGTDCFKSPEDSGFAGFLRSSCAWISYLVQLDSPAAARRYENYLTGFAQQRFSWKPNVRLYGLMAWLDHMQIAQGTFQFLKLVGVGLLIVCLVDTIGLMLAKFLRRSGEIGIRRALGATRRAIYAQFLTEAGLIGVAGGVLSIPLTWLTMLWMRSKMAVGWQWLTQINVNLLAWTVAVAIVATVLAALYPVWRAAHVQPAWQIKSN
ncbi:MAG: FtsX-like permease family protein [Rhodanobacteraceae bacterium]|nr:MAG: FtsX-like permease family protein [Rhodanobacteraceae bacterium]